MARHQQRTTADEAAAITARSIGIASGAAGGGIAGGGTTTIMVTTGATIDRMSTFRSSAAADEFEARWSTEALVASASAPLSLSMRTCTLTEAACSSTVTRDTSTFSDWAMVVAKLSRSNASTLPATTSWNVTAWTSDAPDGSGGTGDGEGGGGGAGGTSEHAPCAGHHAPKPLCNLERRH